MADEFRHANIVEGRLTEDEDEAISEHIFNFAGRRGRRRTSRGRSWPRARPGRRRVLARASCDTRWRR